MFARQSGNSFIMFIIFIKKNLINKINKCDNYY